MQLGFVAFDQLAEARVDAAAEPIMNTLDLACARGSLGRVHGFDRKSATMETIRGTPPADAVVEGKRLTAPPACSTRNDHKAHFC
jgi:hypothetical protein